MSSNPPTNVSVTPELLLLEYLLLTREQMTYQSTVLQSFSTTIQHSTNTIRSLLQRYLEIHDRGNENVSTQPSIQQPRQPSSNINYRIPSTTNDTTSRTTNIGNRRTDYWHSTSPSWASSTNRNYRQSPLSSSSLRRRRVRTPNRTRLRRGRRDILSQILENTLYSGTNRQPASQTDISRNVSIHTWADIITTTDQTMCPITQENFQLTESVSRIDTCGHLFHEQALTTYLTEFDHRCPVCRYNIRTTYPTDPVYMNATTNTILSAAEPPPAYDIPSFQDLSNNPPRTLTRTDSNVLDISFNFSSLGFSNNVTSIPSNLTSTRPFEFDFDPTNFDTAINQLSNAMLSSLSGAMNNPDNSGNTIRADYSLFVPTNVTTMDNATSTEDEETAEA